MPAFKMTFGLPVAVAGYLALTVACSASDPELAPRGGSGITRGDHGASASSTSGLPCPIDQVLAERCQTCHGTKPTAGASTSLVTWDDLQKDEQGKKLYEVVKERVHAETGRMPAATALSTSELATIDDWVAAGAPRANESCEGQGPPPSVVPLSCQHPATVIPLKAAKPFTWRDTGKPDQYMCFGVDEVVRSKKHVIAVGPSVDNANIVHHMILFQTDEALSNEAHPCDAATSTAWKFIAGWAPGVGNFELPPEAGFPVEGTAHWVVQVHYNNASGTHTGESDSSGYQICETNQVRPNDAGVLAFGARKFAIPPRTPEHSVTCDYTLDDRYKGVRFFSGAAHMHMHGSSISTERIPNGKGAPEHVFGQTPFSFENQNYFPIDTSVAPGDVIRTRCAWKNPGDATIKFGENSSDEMCFNFLMYYPAIPDRVVLGVPLQTWITPSFLPDCVETSR